MPKKRPSYRGDRPHSDFITCMYDKMSSVEDFESELLQEIQKHYQVTYHPYNSGIYQQHLEQSQLIDCAGKALFEPRTVFVSLD